jgi:hypothetical protein
MPSMMVDWLMMAVPMTMTVTVVIVLILIYVIVVKVMFAVPTFLVTPSYFGPEFPVFGLLICGRHSNKIKIFELRIE